jgi:hypothetical protein
LKVLDVERAFAAAGAHVRPPVSRRRRSFKNRMASSEGRILSLLGGLPLREQPIDEGRMCLLAWLHGRGPGSRAARR